MAAWERRSASEHYSQNLDEGEGDFFQKFESQPADSTPQAVMLPAEILMVIYLNAPVSHGA